MLYNGLKINIVFIFLKGRYKCEVSAEAPNFQTVFGIANMSVVGQLPYFYYIDVDL